MNIKVKCKFFLYEENRNRKNIDLLPGFDVFHPTRYQLNCQKLAVKPKPGIETIGPELTKWKKKSLKVGIPLDQKSNLSPVLKPNVSSSVAWLFFESTGLKYQRLTGANEILKLLIIS